MNYVVKMTRRRRRILLAGFYFVQLAEMKFALQTLPASRAFTAAYIDGLFKTIYYIAIDNRKKGIVKVEILIALAM